jgi:tetratricopeptide (TPR) repeat protein
MILQIIEDAIKDRPIYFAVTVAPNNRMGLDNYLEMEGLVYKITFEESSSSTSMPRLNYDRMIQNITEAPDSSQLIVKPDDYWNHINAGNGIYRYTNLDNGDVYFNENIQRLIQNYRSSFLQLGLQNLYSSDERGKEKTLDILDKMDSYFPSDVIPTTDAELDIQIGRIYMQAGKPEELKNRLKTVQKRKDVSLETQMYIGQVFMSDFQDYDAAIEHYENLLEEYPYIPDFLYTLVQAYAKAERRSEAVDVLELWLRSHPNDSQAIDWLSILNLPTQ